VTAARISPQARRDILDAARWIAADNPEAARAFRKSIEVAARRLGEHPNIGTVKAELADPPVRFLVVSGFPYLIVYDSELVPPLVLRVLHGARDLPDVLRDM